MIGKGETIKAPVRVDPRHANRKEVIGALSRSSRIMLKLLKAVIDNGGKLPSTPAWLNFPNDIIHFLSYFAAHESHHRDTLIYKISCNRRIGCMEAVFTQKNRKK